MDGNSPGKKKPGMKKGAGKKLFQLEGNRSKELEKMKATIRLEHVLGMTVYSNSALTCDPKTGLVAYPAGCVLVLLDAVKNKQVGTLHTPRKSITAATFSPDGRYIVTGESGLQPAVRVWELHRMMEVAILRGHSVGIASVSFSPRMREIIVVGEAQDMMISVWAWPAKVMKALNKFADEIYAMAISEDSKFFITVGNRHVKFYYMENIRSWPNQVDNPCPIPLPIRCGILDNLKENCFCDVVCGRGCSKAYVFVITVSGILCQINRNRLLERWVNVNMLSACCVTADENNVFVGGAQGVVRMFHALDLQIILTLPRPHSLGLDISQYTQVTPSYREDQSEDITEEEDERGERGQGVRYPATRAMSYDYTHENLTVVYDDHSIYIWTRDMKVASVSDGWYHFSKKYSSMYHRGCVWDLTTYPVALETESEGENLGGAFPPGALISVSADGTLRAWDVCAKICEESVLKRNCLSAECLKIVYADKMEGNRRIREKTRQQNKSREGSAGLLTRHGKQSFSVVAVCPDGLHIATGNRNGQLCIYDTNTMRVEATMLAHEAEVTALSYSITKRYKILASGSRDRMIHVMDASRGYQLLTTLDDHSSTITAISFTYIARCLLMITSSLDMSVLVRAYLDSNIFSFKPVRAIVEKKSVMDFTIHPWSGLMALACQDRLVRIYSIMSSVENNSFRGCPSYGGQLIKIQIDPSGQYLLTACTNKTINLLQFNTGVMLSTFNGHAENITCIKFSHNMKHVISSAIDGCIFLWRLPEWVTYTVKREMAEMGRLTRGMVLSERWKKSRLLEGVRIKQPHTQVSVDLKLQPVNVQSEPNLKKARQIRGLKSACSAADTFRDLQPHQRDRRNTTPCPELNYAEEKKEEEEEQCPDVESPHSDGKQGDNDMGEAIVEGEMDLWVAPPVEEVFTPPMPRAFSSTRDHQSRDDGILRLMNNQEQPLRYSHNYSPTLRTPSAFASTSEAWLTACYERRRIFKLEAKSIKKILAMMRLVTDAMEKDLANTDWLMYSHPTLGTNNNLSEAGVNPVELDDAVACSSGRMEMVVSASMRPVQQSQNLSTPPQQQRQQSGYPSSSSSAALATTHVTYSKQQGLWSSPRASESGRYLWQDKQGSSGQLVQQQDYPDFSAQQQQRSQCPSRIPIRSTSTSSQIISKPVETLTIKVSTDSSVSGGVESFPFYNDLESFSYSSAVHHISEALEKRSQLQRASTTSFLRHSFMHSYENSRGDLRENVTDDEDDDDDDDESDDRGVSCLVNPRWNNKLETHTQENRKACAGVSKEDNFKTAGDSIRVYDVLNSEFNVGVADTKLASCSVDNEDCGVSFESRAAVDEKGVKAESDDSNDSRGFTYSYEKDFSCVFGVNGNRGRLEGGRLVTCDSQADFDSGPERKADEHEDGKGKDSCVPLDTYLSCLLLSCDDNDLHTELSDVILAEKDADVLGGTENCEQPCSGDAVRSKHGGGPKVFGSRKENNGVEGRDANAMMVGNAESDVFIDTFTPGASAEVLISSVANDHAEVESQDNVVNNTLNSSMISHSFGSSTSNSSNGCFGASHGSDFGSDDAAVLSLSTGMVTSDVIAGPSDDDK